MAEDTMRLLREVVVDGKAMFQCMACDATWVDGRGPEHHARCRIGNLQVLVKSLMRERDELRKHFHVRSREDGSRSTALGVIADWRRWAEQLLGKVAVEASDAALRFRLEERMRPEASSTERALRLQIVELAERLDAALRSQRDLEDLVRRGLEL